MKNKQKPKKLFLLVFATCVAIQAQGGWEVWNIRLKNGKTVFASPLVSANEKVVIYGVGSKYEHESSIRGAFRIEREKILFIENAMEDSRPKTLVPEVSTEDLIILRDGQKLSGKIKKISSRSLWETTLFMECEKIDLREVAVIKFARNKTRGPEPKPNYTKLDDADIRQRCQMNKRGVYTVITV